MQTDIFIFWKTRKFIRIVISIQLLVLGTIGLDIIGLEIPLIRQIVSIIYLTFVPGILILRLFRLYDLNPVEFLLYSIGLSVSFLMFSGLLINTLYHLIGISNPLSGLNIIFSILLFTSIMVVLLYRFDRYQNVAGQDGFNTEHIILKDILYFSLLILVLLISILGAYRVNSYNDNSLLLVLVALLILLLILICFDVIKRFYPVTVFMITLSVLYSISLISKYLTGYDIQMEHYFYRLVEINSIWNSYIPDIDYRTLNINSMLSVTILPLIYNKFLNISGIDIFKIVFPFIFAFSFVGLYYVYTKLMDNKRAFFSVMLSISFIYFISFEMISLARQMIAQLFFVLLLVLMLNKEISRVKKYGLYVIFAFSLIVSHYGLSYIYMFILISIFIIKYIFNIYKDSTESPSFFSKNMILCYAVFAISWYIYSSNSSVFNSIIKIGSHTVSGISDFSSIGNRETNVLMAIGLRSPGYISFERYIHQWIQIATQLFILIGSILSLTRNKHNFDRDYILFLPISLGLVFVSIILPYFSRETMNMTRLYQVTLMILSPYFIIGGEAFIGKLFNIRYILKSSIYRSLTLKLLILFVLVPYFAFNSGLIYEITKDEPILTPLGIERIKISGNNISKSSLYDAYITEQDIMGATWLSNHRNIDWNIYAPRRGYSIFSSYTKSNKNVITIKNGTEFQKDSYVYSRYVNVHEDIFSYDIGMGRSKIISNDELIRKIPMLKDRIYNDGGSQTFLLRIDK